MSDKSTTANPPAQDEDSANLTEQKELDSKEHLDPETVTEEDPSEEKNENPEAPKPEDSKEGAPDGEDEEGKEEELDPLEKAKKHADRKIRELGDKAATGEKLIIAAVAKAPELLIEMFDESSEMFNPDLGKRIATENPDVYNRANEEFKRRQIAQGRPAAPAQAPAETDIKKIVAQVLEEERGKASEQSQMSEFQKELGMTDAQFQVLLPSLTPIASALRSADETLDAKAALERAFIAMFPGDFQKAAQRKVINGIAQKRAMTTLGGGGDAAPTKSDELTAAQEAAWKNTNLPRERFIRLVQKYPDKFN